MAYLIVERAGVIVERRKLDRDRLSVGRGSDSDVVLDDPQIGSKLLVIAKDGGSYVLEDQGSMTGVSYQNERVTRLVLKDGMRLEAFPFTFIFQDEEGGGGGGGGSDDRVEATMAMDMSMPGESAELVCVNENFGPFTLKAGVNVVGRKAGLDITVDHKMVSKEHALIICIPGEFVVEDKASANGTFVNRRKVTRAPLKDGDLVQFGGVEFKLVVASADDGEAPASQTQDIEVGGLLLGGALEQQAQALGSEEKSPKKAQKGKKAAKSGKSGDLSTPGPIVAKSKSGGKGKVVLLGGVGCLGLGLVGILAMVAMSPRKPPPPKQASEAQLRLEQAKSILQADENHQAGIDLIDQVLASNPPAAVAEDAKKVKDQLLVALRRPTPIGKMNPGQLRDAGNERVAKGKILESVRYWERLVTIDPTWEDCGKTYATLMYQIGLIYDGAGNREMALQVWKRCIAVMGEAATDNPAHAKVRGRLRDLGENP